MDSPAVPLLKSIAALWDETIVLDFSEIGEVAAFVRRRGDTWYLAILNGPTARTVQVPLPFLGTGDYRAMIVKDSPSDAGAMDLDDKAVVLRGDTLTVELREGGGFVAWVSPAAGR